jgi:hypothetical protein
MFEVTGVKRRFWTKEVELTALDEMTGTKVLVFPGGRLGPHAYQCPYNFPIGSKITANFTPWSAVPIGARIDLSEVLKRRSIQRWLMRGSRVGL